MIAQRYSQKKTLGDMSLQRRRTGLTWVEILVILGIMVLLIALLAPSMRFGNTREAARRSQCKNNLKQIGLALYNYHDAYGAFPPAYTVDSHGKPLHSWRTLILPYLDQESLYQKINLAKPWDDPANVDALKSFPPTYSCPSATNPPGMTTYLAVTGKDSCFRPGQSRMISEITDGTSNTLMVVDITQTHAVHWMSPQDADEALLLGMAGEVKDLQHIGGFQGALADGSVRFFSVNLPATTLKALISISANDTVGEF